MTEWSVELEFEEGTSSKFWRARVEGRTLYVNYGKIGTNGQTQVKDFSDAAGAAKELDKLIREKRKKGYVDAAAREADEDEDDDDEEEDEDEEEEEADDEPPPERKPAAKPAPAAKPPAAAAGRAPDATLVLDAGNRKVETRLYLDGKTVRMDAAEAYASPEAAKKAFDRLRKALTGEGYKEA